MHPIRRWRAGLVALAALAAGCGGEPEPPAAAPDVAVTSTYLACAVKDVAGDATPVLALAPPGMCPGHFDLRPSQVQALRRCRLLLRFGFQESLDAKIGGAAEGGPAIRAVTVAEGMALPATYVGVCEQTAAALAETGPAEAFDVNARLRAIRERMARLGFDARNEARAGRLAGRGVVASEHQAAFCRWLGLEVATTFTASDTTTAADISRAIAAGEKAAATLIVANRPEGRRVADALADRLNARVAVLDNFPAEAAASGFDAMVRANVRALVEAAP